MLNQKERSYNQKLLIASNIAIVPLITSFGGADASLLQLYATSILGLQESEIGFAIGLLSLVIPLQLVGIYFVKRWGSKQTLTIGFGLLFLLMPLMLVIPVINVKNTTLGFAFFCITILLMNIVHNTTKGIAFQPTIRESTLPEERGWFFSKMRLTTHGFNLLFFAILSVTLGEKIALQNYVWIALLLMIYCLWGCGISYGLKTSEEDKFSYTSWQDLVREIPEAFANGQYRLLMTIMILCSFSFLPLFVTYLTIGLKLNVSDISALISLNTIGSISGLLVWGRLIDRFGFMRILYCIVLMLAAVGPLWLFVEPIELPYRWLQLSSIALASITAIAGFLQSGFKIALVVGIHNTAMERSAVAALALFNSMGMILGSLVPAGVGFYLSFTLGSPTISLGAGNIDSYQGMGLFGALLCLLSAAICWRSR